MANRVAIVGVGQTYHQSKRPDVSQPELANEAVRAALADAQLSMKDVESVFVSNMETFEGVYLPDHWMADEIGCFMKPGFKIAAGGTSGIAAAKEAFHFLTAGLFNTGLLVGFEKHDTLDTTAAITAATTLAWGKGAARGAIGEFAKQAANYMKQSGTCKKPLRENESLKDRVTADLASMKKDKPLLRSFFEAESVAYTIY